MNGEPQEFQAASTPQQPRQEPSVSSPDAAKFSLKLRAIGVNAVTIFCRQLSTLVDVGIPLLKCLQILHQRTSHEKLQAVILQLSLDIEQGRSFSTALEKFPSIFSPFFINMTKVAEKGGALDESLKLVADVMEKEELIRQKVRDALYYPMITLGVGVFVVILLIAVIVPMFGDLYAQQNNQRFNRVKC